MNLTSSRSHLAALTRELQNHWEDTKEHWRDAKSLEFEKKYIQELLASVNAALSTLERLERITSSVIKDCE